MSIIGIPLDLYLDTLKSMSLEDNPYVNDPEADVLAPATVALAHALAEFVETLRDNLKEDGYEAARIILENMVHTFPAPEHADGMSLEQVLSTLFDGGKLPFGGIDLA